MKIIQIIGIILLAVVAKGCCKKEAKNTLKAKDIYILGTTDYKACYWKNGVKNIVSTTNNITQGHDVEVNNGNIYVLGTEYFNFTPTPRYWANGVPTTLESDSTQVYAYRMAVSNGDVYIAGQYVSNGIGKAKLWKNGKAITLSDTNYHCDANDVAAIGNDIYVVGSEKDATGTKYATLWKNGVPQYLTKAGEDGNASTIKVIGATVYIFGDVDNQKTIWKNGVTYKQFTEPSDFSTFDFYADDNRVYIVGQKISTGGYSVASELVDGQVNFIDIDKPSSSAYRIMIVGENKYVLLRGSGGITLSTNNENNIIDSLGFPGGIFITTE